MILKKPYAFFIKHFKLLHLIIFSLSVYALYKTTPIVTFFRSYVANNYSVGIGYTDIGNIIPVFLYFAIIFILLLNIIIISLFVYKGKKFSLYLFYTIYYIVLLISLFLVKGTILSLQESSLAPDIARIYKDVSIIIYLPQILYIAVCGVRALGFNIRQFNFEKDYKDLEISNDDNAEVELSFGIETYKTRRSIRKFFREFKYYLRENLFMILIIVTIGLAIIVYVIFASYEKFVYKYKLGEQFSMNNLVVSIDDSIITNLDAGGNTIPNNKHYLLLKVSVSNNTTKDVDFDYKNIKLYYSDTDYLDVVNNVSKYFVDYAAPLNNSKMAPQSSGTYVLAYEVNQKIVQNKLFLKIYTGLKTKSNLYYATSAIISIDPIIISEISQLGEVNLNSPLNLSGTYLLNSSVTIKEFEVTDKYIFDYKVCNKSQECRDYKDIITRSASNESVLVLKGNVVIDKNSGYSKNPGADQKFVNYFLKVEYTKDGTRHISSLNNVTPNTFKDGYIFKAHSGLLNADTIKLIVTIRNKRYYINLKS